MAPFEQGECAAFVRAQRIKATLQRIERSDRFDLAVRTNPEYRDLSGDTSDRTPQRVLARPSRPKHDAIRDGLPQARERGLADIQFRQDGRGTQREAPQQAVQLLGVGMA